MRDAMKKAREDKDLSMPEAAERAGITTSYWSYIESGQKTPTLDVAGRIGEVLEVEPSSIFEELRRTKAPIEEVEAK